MRNRLALAVLVAVALSGGSEQASAKPKSFVFAKINGQKLDVTGKGKPTDKCLNGIHNATSGVFTFGGVECRHGRPIPRGHVQVVASTWCSRTPGSPASQVRFKRAVTAMGSSARRPSAGFSARSSA